MNPSFLLTNSQRNISLESKLKSTAHGNDFASIKTPAFVIPTCRGTSMQKTFTPMKLPLSQASVAMSTPIMALPQGIHILSSPPLLPPMSVPPSISSSPSSSSSSLASNIPCSTPPNLPSSNGRPPSIALCLSKDNARQLFLCLLQQQQQQNISSSANFLKNHIHQEKIQFQVQPQDAILTTIASRSIKKSPNIKLLSPTRLKSLNQENVMLMHSEVRNPFQQIISVYPKPNDLSKILIGSSNVDALPPVIPPIAIHPSKINGIINRRPLIRFDTSLEKFRSSSHSTNKSTVQKSGKELSSSQSSIKPSVEEHDNLLKIFHSPFSRELLMTSSTSLPLTSNISPQESTSSAIGKKIDLQRKLGMVKTVKKNNQITEKTCPPKYINRSNTLRTKNKRSRVIMMNIRSTNQTLKHDRSRISHDQNVDISTNADLTSSSDESNHPAFHRRWWNASSGEVVEADEETLISDASPFMRIRKFDRLVGREKKRLRLLRESLITYEMMTDGEKNFVDELKLRCFYSSECSGRNPRDDQDTKTCSTGITRLSKKANILHASLQSCLHQDGEGIMCSHLALPYTNHCIKHIMYGVDQHLYTYCTAKCSDNIQCCIPVLNSGPPLCSKHLHVDTNQNLCMDVRDMGPFTTEPKRKCQAAILKRGKKKRTSSHEMIEKKIISKRCDESLQHHPTFDCLTGSLDQSLLSADDLSTFELMAEVPFNSTKESLDDVLSNDFLEDLDPFFDSANCFLETPDVHDVFGKFPVEVFDFGTTS